MNEIQLPIMGGCLCGAVRYEIASRPGATAICHCTDCQKTTGSAFSIAVSVRKKDFRITKGEPRLYELSADTGGRVRRYFCGTCGSSLFGKPDSMPRAVNVLAGTLDDPSWFRPQMSIFIHSAQPWVPTLEGIPQLEGMPKPSS